MYLVKLIKEDYYKPILVKSAFKSNYKKYETEETKRKNYQ